MASLFDNIFKPNSALPLASLFSQDSKFRSAQAAPQAAKPGSKPAGTNGQVPSASLDGGKKTKGSKKRKASALEANEPAITTKAVEPVSNSTKSGKRHSTPAVLQKPARNKAEQPQVPAAKASESKPNKKRKAIADSIALNPKATGSKALGKQKRAAPARDSNVEAVASTATVPGLSSGDVAQSASQEHDIYDEPEEQAASQVGNSWQHLLAS